MLQPYRNRQVGWYQRSRPVRYAAGAAVSYQAVRSALGQFFGGSRQKGYQKYKASYRRKYGGGKAPLKKKNFKKKKTGLSKVKSQLKTVSRKVNANLSTHTYRLRNVNRHIATANQQDTSINNMSTASTLDNSVAALRFFNPSVPGTLITADLGASTYAQGITIKKIFSQVVARNNYNVPLNLRMYICVPKVDTSISPTSAWSNGLTDQNNPSIYYPNVYPTDSKQFNELWSIDSSKKVLLNPGQQCVMSFSSARPFSYDPSLEDNHGFTYMKDWYPAVCLTQIHGVIAHDSALDEQGSIGCGIDVVVDTTIKIEYNAGGPPLDDITVSNASATPTNGFVVGNRPANSNQSYSLT